MFHVGDVVRKLREARGWTLQALSAASGVNKMTISEIENGRNYKRDTLAKLASALGLPAARLESKLREWAEAEVGPVTLTDAQRELLAVWAGLEADGREARLAEMRREASLVARAHHIEADALALRLAVGEKPPARRRGRAR